MVVMVAGSATETRPGKAADAAPPTRAARSTTARSSWSGKRWTGAILLVLMEGPLRFSEVRQLVPDLSDRLLSERLKELEAEGIVQRTVIDDMPVRVEYELTDKGRALEPAVRALKSWANDWL